MAGVTITPATIGGPFTNLIAYFPSLTVTSQNGGRISKAGFTGSGASIAVNSYFTDDMSASGLAGNWSLINLSEDQKIDPWSSGSRLFALGTREPWAGPQNSFVEDSGSPPPSPAPIEFVAYFDNSWNAGEVGPEENFIRYSGDWGCISTQPVTGVSDLTSVKSYPANQIQFDTPYPAISSFNAIRAYADVVNPAKPASGSPDIIYEAAWDIYGQAHTAVSGISLEVMFWTYNHNQNPGSIGPRVESGIDLNGDGKLWDLYMTPDTAATGGVTNNYSYCIWYLQDEYQEDAGWVNILAGLRYVCEYYVVPSGPGAPSDPLDIPIFQITRGWEICSTLYTPTEFRMRDYRIVLE